MALLLVVLPAAAPARPSLPPSVEVVVTMRAPSLATLHLRSLAGARGARLDLRAPRSVSYLRRLASAQRSLGARIARAIPGSAVRWHYSVVLDGMAVVVPRGQAGRLGSIPGVGRVWPNLVYHPLLDRTPQLIGATQLWGPALATAGQGMKIAIIDQGIDQTHPFFNPAGFTYPPGFPKGNTAYTTPKVIVARAFPGPGGRGPLETLPFVGVNDVDDHGTHVAGIAAGDADTPAKGVRVSGIAPRAYLGNYKAATLPTPEFGLNMNAPELVAAIEAAVTDGMDVINISFGEPEIDPSRDVVVRALDAAADAGVVSTIAAGNDFADFGNGSIGSPANAPKAISVAASTGGHGSPTPDRIADFSSGGPAPYSLQLKPDVTAPGAGVLSSVPSKEGSWDEFSGTSMAAPHVAGAAALLKQRHPGWTVEQIKSALVLTGVPVRRNGRELPAAREGGGRIALVSADNPLVFSDPTSLSFRLLRPGESVKRSVALTDAGGGAGTWSTRLQLQGPGRGLRLSIPSSVDVPGSLTLGVHVGKAAARDVSGFLVLSRSETTRRVPFWFRIERPRLRLDRELVLRHTGAYRGTTVGAGSHVTDYRYPDLSTTTVPFPRRLPGPEVVYRFRLKRPVANLGVAVTARSPGMNIQPRIVRDGDENQLAGYTALPVDLNDYRRSFGDARPVAGVILPAPGTYDLVFDSTARSSRGTFAFRFWVGDTTPPSARVLSARGGVLKLSVRDGGAGVDPLSFGATIDGRGHPVEYSDGVARIFLGGVSRGKHTLVFRAADYQETKNMEDVGPVLPNTRTLRTTILVP